MKDSASAAFDLHATWLKLLPRQRPEWATSLLAADGEVRGWCTEERRKSWRKAVGCQHALSSDFTVILQDHLQTKGADSWTARCIPRGDLQTTFTFKGFEEVKSTSCRVSAPLTLQWDKYTLWSFCRGKAPRCNDLCTRGCPGRQSGGAGVAAWGRHWVPRLQVRRLGLQRDTEAMVRSAEQTVAQGDAPSSHCIRTASSSQLDPLLDTVRCCGVTSSRAQGSAPLLCCLSPGACRWWCAEGSACSCCTAALTAIGTQRGCRRVEGWLEAGSM